MRRWPFSVLLCLLAGLASAQSLSFRLDPDNGHVSAVFSGYRPLCACYVQEILRIDIVGTDITIETNTTACGGNCVPPADYHGPYYEVIGDLGRLSAPLYTVQWRQRGTALVATVSLAPASLGPRPIPALSGIAVTLASALVGATLLCIGRGRTNAVYQNFAQGPRRRNGSVG